MKSSTFLRVKLPANAMSFLLKVFVGKRKKNKIKPGKSQCKCLRGCPV